MDAECIIVVYATEKVSVFTINTNITVLIASSRKSAPMTNTSTIVRNVMDEVFVFTGRPGIIVSHAVRK